MVDACDQQGGLPVAAIPAITAGNESDTLSGHPKGPDMREQNILLEATFENAAKYFALAIAVPIVLTIVLIPALLIVVPLVYFIRKVEYDRIRCFLTDRTLVVHRGVFNKREQTIPLEKITDLGIVQGPIMRHCNVEAIAVETAGQSGQGGALVQLVGVKDARGFRDRVLDQRDSMLGLNEDTPRPSPTSSTTAHAAPVAPLSNADSEVLVEIRDSLLRIERSLGDRGDS